MLISIENNCIKYKVLTLKNKTTIQKEKVVI